MNSPSTPALDISGLRFTYPGAHHAAKPVVDVAALAIAPGEMVLLTGGSGSGKSTLLQLIAGLLDPDSGRVLVGGTNIHELHGPQRDRFRGERVGMIFQTFNLLHGFSALENVMAALMFSAIPSRTHRDLALAALARLGIERIDAPVQTLSVGQQQRVAVARAIVCGPVLVLADEPTASLDPENAAGAMDLIQSVVSGATGEVKPALLCVSHDPAMVTRFPRVERLHELRSDASGPRAPRLEEARA